MGGWAKKEKKSKQTRAANARGEVVEAEENEEETMRIQAGLRVQIRLLGV